MDMQWLVLSGRSDVSQQPQLNFATTDDVSLYSNFLCGFSPLSKVDPGVLIMFILCQKLLI